MCVFVANNCNKSMHVKVMHWLVQDAELPNGKPGSLGCSSSIPPRPALPHFQKRLMQAMSRRYRYKQGLLDSIVTCAPSI